MADEQSGATRLVGRFFAWWGGELAALVPAPLRNALARRAPLRVLEFSGTDLRIVDRGDSGTTELARFSVADLADRPDPATVAAAQKLARKGAPSAIALPNEQTLSKTLTLPQMAAADLRDALAFQIDRQTPFAPGDVYFDYRVRERDSEAKRLSVELLVAPRTVVERAVRTARALGFEPSAVSGAGIDPFALNLLPPAMAPRRRNLKPLLAALLVVALAAGAWMLAQTALSDKSAEAQALAQRVELVRQRADKLQALKDERDGLLRQSQFLRVRKAQTPKPVLVIEELTRALPDHTWLFQLQQDGTQLRLSGYTSDASSLIGLIGALPMFDAPKFGSPVTHDPRRNKDRFNLIVDIVPPAVAAPAATNGATQ